MEGTLDDNYTTACYRQLDSGELDAIFSKLRIKRQKPVVLDIGCGPGHWLIAARRILDAVALGGDVCQHMFPIVWTHAADRQISSINLAQMNLVNLPVRDESIDCLICRQVLSYVRDEDQAIRELARAVKPGGYLILGAAGFGLNLRELLRGSLRVRISALKCAVGTLWYFLTGIKLRPNANQSLRRLKRILLSSDLLILESHIRYYLGFPDLISFILHKKAETREPGGSSSSIPN